MQKLNKMLLREIKNSKGQFIAAAAVIFVGIFMYAATYMSYHNLKNSIEFYYEQYSFLDYYAEAQSISPFAVSQVKALPGVEEAIGRVSVDVGADMGEDQRVTIRLVSLPDRKIPEINQLFFISGTSFNPKVQNACLVAQKFAEAHKLEEGDSIQLIIHKRTYEFKISGVVGSPEFIYAMKSKTSFSPSTDDFGIIYIRESTARSLLGFEDAYNQLHVIFEEGVEQKPIIHKIEDILRPYGFLTGIQRKDQLSNMMVNQEIEGLEQMAYAYPFLFLTVAALIIYIMQRRLINNQRTFIGVMKAFGYTNGRILRHYLLDSLLIAVVGTLPGILLGLYLGRGMTAMYNDFFSIPVMRIQIYWDIVFAGIAMSMAFCLLAGYNAAKRVIQIQPAKAMRPEIPKAGKRILLERFGVIWQHIPFGWKMSIRNIFRSRQRTIFTMIGISFTIMFFMVSWFFMDCMDYILTEHFFKFQQQDLKVTFTGPVSVYDALDLKSVKGIKKIEPILEVPIEVRHGWKTKGTLAVGLTPQNSFYRLINENRSPIGVPENGILIAHVLADSMSIQPGDTVIVKPYMGTVTDKKVKVAGVVKQYAGFNCYMSLDELGALTGEGRFATGALLTVEKEQEKAVYDDLLDIPGVETVESRMGGYRGYMQYMDLMYFFIGLMVVFGTIMGFAIIFNTTIINIMERRRELASLKVLGYTGREIENTIFRENMLLGLTAIMPGILLGRTACEQLARNFSTDLFALEVVIYPRTYIITIISTFIFIILAQWANKKKISGLDMIEVLKNREG